MGHEGADAHHGRGKLPDEAKVLGQTVCRLARRAHHKAGAHLVADLFQVPQAALPVFQAQLRRVQAAVMGRVCRFVPQQVPVGPRVKQRLVRGPAPFPHRKGHGAAGPAGFDFPHQGAEPFVGEVRVLAPLQHKGAEPQPVPGLAAGQNLLLRKAVPLRPPVAPTDAAVQAVVFAVIGKFDQAPGVHPASEPGPGGRPGPLPGEGHVLCGGMLQQKPPFLPGKAAVPLQLFQQGAGGGAVPFPVLHFLSSGARRPRRGLRQNPQPFSP